MISVRNMRHTQHGITYWAMMWSFECGGEKLRFQNNVGYPTLLARDGPAGRKCCAEILHEARNEARKLIADKLRSKCHERIRPRGSAA